ncbi:MAG: hypothetical protein M1818_000005 [Claussenomyces sp. TS43310]|nr:MAG: hypothetical protein M1818_000005 [Claussenomyces sp. TS43310]
MLLLPILRQRGQRSKVPPSAVESPLGISPDDDDNAARKRPQLLAYEELPDWHQDNECIRQGYRAVSNSSCACFASWSYLHNETVNIYTHLIPAIFILITASLAYGYLQIAYPAATATDRLIFAFFFLAAATCLALSALYHTLLNHSQYVSGLWLRLDFLGIIILTLGKFISGVYVAFYCEPFLYRTYWTMITTLGTITMAIVVNPRFQGRRWRTFRALAFIATGLSGFVPVLHGIFKFGFTPALRRSGLGYYLAEGVLLMLGAFFYTTRIPESLRPGKFDVFFSSHQIFHILVVLAATVHLLGILSAFDYHYVHQVC